MARKQHERQPANYRRAAILDAAYNLANKRGTFQGLTGDAVTAACNCTRGLVRYYFGTLQLLHLEVVSMAVHRKNAALVAAAVREGLDEPDMPRALQREVRRLLAAQ